jgi:hypothetical protein
MEYPLSGSSGSFANKMENMNMLKRNLCILASLILVSPLTAIGLDSSATVVVSRGMVSAASSGDERVLGQGDAVFVSDTVTTGDKSFAVLQFIDGAKVTVRPNTTMLIEEYAYTGSDQDAASLSLVEGGLRVITGAMAKNHPDNYKVKTPVALMGVRGTEFAVMYCGDKACDEAEVAGLEAHD